MTPLSVGVLGCGTISDAYLSGTDRFDSFEITACADIDHERAEAKATEYGVEAVTVDGLHGDESVDAVVNLTPPTAHAATCERLLDAGKHVYVEKPLAATVEDAERILELAADAELLVGSAPDTFLGAGLQTARSVLDDGTVGDPVGATAVWVSGGHENWHPNPDFYYHEGGGPLFDMGPYYVTALVSLLGPVERVTGTASRTHDERTITSEPRAGEPIDVEVPTHETAVLEFEGGATANLLLSFDAPGGSTLPEPAFELYGTDGTLGLPDPNHFEGPVRVRDAGSETAEEVPLTHEYTGGRGAGVADLASAVDSDWDHRTSADLAYHVFTVLDGARTAAERSEHVSIETTCDRPEPLPQGFPDRS